MASETLRLHQVTPMLRYAPSDGSITTVTLEGSFRSDIFGRIVADQCPSDHEHLRSAPTDPEKNKPSCRFLLEEFFGDVVGKRGKMTLSFVFEETP